MEKAIVGVANAVAPAATASGRLRTRMNFAVQHLLSAARFARKSHELEAEHAEESLGSFFDEIISYVSASILSSVASLEANINEIFVDAEMHFPEHKRELLHEIWNAIEQKSILEKYQMALALKTGEKLARGEAICQDADSLIKLRNGLVHFKPEWPDEQEIHKKIEQRLTSKFSLSPFIVGGAFFPQKCMSYGCAKWAVLSSLSFMSRFSQKAGLVNKFDKFRNQLVLP